MGAIIPAALGIRLLPHRAGESGVMMKVERKCKIVSKEKMGDAIYMVLEVGDMVRTSCKGSMAPSGRESMSNFSRSLVAAMSRSVPST